MAKRYKEPDKLALDMMQCKADGYGCHYGHWKAAQDPVQIVKKQEVPEGWRVCEWCGKPYKPKTKRAQKYCEPYCATQALRERDLERKRKKREAQKAGAYNG